MQFIEKDLIKKDIIEQDIIEQDIIEQDIIEEESLMTTEDLKNFWKRFDDKPYPVSVFYGYNNSNPCFSNFYRQTPFVFTIPAWCGTYAKTPVLIDYSEKAIMLCKASLMNDTTTYLKILNCEKPDRCKLLGRKVKPFDDALWKKYVCNIAYEVTLAKFTTNPGLKDALKATGKSIIAEASPTDKVWGIGMNCSNKNNQYPVRWEGTNILGWALMEVRQKIIERELIEKDNTDNKYDNKVPSFC